MDYREGNRQFMTAAGLLPERLWRAAFTLSAEERLHVEEFRLRVGRPFCAVTAGKQQVLRSEERRVGKECGS